MEKGKNILKDAGVLLIIVILVLTTLSLFTPMASADKPSGNGYDANGYNWKAHTWNGWGWTGIYDYVWCSCKWSRDWQWNMATLDPEPWYMIPNDATTIVGSTFVLNYQWYSNTLDGFGLDDTIPWDGHVAPNADYMFIYSDKTMKVSDNLEAWSAFVSINEDGHPYTFHWANGVPKYIYFQAHLNVYEHGSLIAMIDFVTAHPYGLGQPIW